MPGQPDFSDAAEFGLTVSATPPSAPRADFSDAAQFGLTVSPAPPTPPTADFSDAARFGLTLSGPPAPGPMPPGLAPMPLPAALAPSAPEINVSNPITPIAHLPANDASWPGIASLQQGIEQVQHGDNLRGAGHVALGVTGALSPALLVLGATAPLDAATWYAGSKALEKTTELGGLASGMKPEDAREVGEVASLAPIAVGGFRIAQGKLAGAIESHNARAAQLVAEDAARGQGADMAAHVLGEEMPVGTQGWKVVPNGASAKGRPNYAVQDATGKTIFAGNGGEVQQFLKSKGVERTPTAPEQPPVAPEPAPIVEQAPAAPAATATPAPGAAQPPAAPPGSPEVQRFRDVGRGLEELQHQASEPESEQPEQQAAPPQPRIWTKEAATPAPGFVRLYRGEHPTRRFSDVFNPDILPESIRNSRKSGGWWTSDRNYAEYFRDSMGPGAQVHYIDVPAEVAQAHAIEKSPDLFKGREYERGYVYFFPELFQGGETEGAATEAAQTAPEAEAPVPPAQSDSRRSYGNAVEIAVPGEPDKVYLARYALQEAGDVQPSHNPFSFEPNPDYPHTNERNYSTTVNAARVAENSAPGNFNTSYVVTPSPTAENGHTITDEEQNALGANARTMMQQRVYARGGADAEKLKADTLEAATTYGGVAPEEAGQYTKPLLSRELIGPLSPEEAQAAIRDFNKTGTAALSPAERAIADARRVSPDTLEYLGHQLAEEGDDATLAKVLGGPKGPRIVNRLIEDGVISPQEKPQYLDERGIVTPEGKQRIARLAVGRLFDSPAAYEHAAPELRNKLERIAGPLARVEDDPAWSLSSRVKEAVRLVTEAKQRGVKNLDDLAAQGHMFGGGGYAPETIALAKTLQLGPRKAAEAFQQYASDHAVARSGAMLGFVEPPTPEEAFQAAFVSRDEVPAGRMMRPFPDIPFDKQRADPREVLRDARVVYRGRRGGFTGTVYVNPQARDLLEGAGDLYDEERNSAALHLSYGRAVQVIRRLAYSLVTNRYGLRAIRPLLALRQALDSALHQNGSVLIVDAGPGRTLAAVRADIRHELHHAHETEFTPKRAEEFLEDPLAYKAKEALLEHPGYSHLKDNPVGIVSEIGAHLQGGPRHWADIEQTPEQADVLWRRYVRYYPGQFRFERMRPTLRKAANEELASKSGSTDLGQHGAPGSNREGPGRRSIRRGVPEDVRAGRNASADRTPSSGQGSDLPPLDAGRRSGIAGTSGTAGETRSLFDAATNEQIASESARDRDTLEGERLTAQLNAPLTREEQLKKLKRSKENKQSSMFEDNSPAQGSLLEQFLRDESGAFDPVALRQHLGELFRGTKEGEPLRNYSGMGAMKSFLVRNLSQLEDFPAAHLALVRAASWKAQAAALIRAAWPRIVQALGEDATPDEFRAGLIESRLLGTEQRWRELAAATATVPDEELPDWVLSGPLQVLDNMSDDDLAQQAAAMVDSGRYRDLRRFVAGTFENAAGSVHHLMPREAFAQLIRRLGFRKALAVYKLEIEPHLAENHARNEGVFSDALGPLQTYYPLVPLRADDEAAAMFGARRGFKKPLNLANQFATGLAQNYDASMQAFADRIGAALRANDKASAIQELQDAGILRKLKPGEHADTVWFNGREYAAKVVETGPARTIVENGKAAHLAPQRAAIAEPFYHEVKPILEPDAKLPPNMFSRLLNVISRITLSGPADAVYHSHNLLGALIANTPFLGEGLAAKTIGNTPFTKAFTAIGKLASTDPMDEAAVRDLREMSKLGLLPERFGSVTFSKEYAALTGAKRARPGLSFAPILYGPKGIDVRARLIMYRLAKVIQPDASPLELYKFVNQLGNYTASLQGRLERVLKRTGFSPFYTAGSTMIRNGIDAWLGVGPGAGPGGARSNRLAQLLSGGAIGVVAAWAITYRLMTGKWPWEDRRAKLLKIPVPENVRRSRIGLALWGHDMRKVGYLNFGFASPLVSRGARALGFQNAADTAFAGGNAAQIAEGVKRDIANSALHPVMGPPARVALMAATGKEAYLVSDREGGSKFLPGLPRKAPLGSEFLYAAKELNSFYGNVGAATGFGGPDDAQRSATEQIFKAIVDMTGIASPPSNPYGMRRALAEERYARR